MLFGRNDEKRKKLIKWLLNHFFQKRIKAQELACQAQQRVDNIDSKISTALLNISKLTEAIAKQTGLLESLQAQKKKLESEVFSYQTDAARLAAGSSQLYRKQGYTEIQIRKFYDKSTKECNKIEIVFLVGERKKIVRKVKAKDLSETLFIALASLSIKDEDEKVIQLLKAYNLINDDFIFNGKLYAKDDRLIEG